MDKIPLSIIAAIGKNRELGKNNQLLWHISEDLKHFKAITKGHTIIMGNKTFQSIGKPLPERLNIIISRNVKYNEENLKSAPSLENAVETAKKYEKNNNQPEIFIIGGGSIYHQAIKITDKLYLTLVNDSFEADTFFPEYTSFFPTIISESAEKNDNGLSYKFIELAKS